MLMLSAYCVVVCAEHFAQVPRTTITAWSRRRPTGQGLEYGQAAYRWLTGGPTTAPTTAPAPVLKLVGGNPLVTTLPATGGTPAYIQITAYWRNQADRADEANVLHKNLFW